MIGYVLAFLMVAFALGTTIFWSITIPRDRVFKDMPSVERLFWSIALGWTHGFMWLVAFSLAIEVWT